MDLHPNQFRVQIAQIVRDPDYINRAVEEYEREWLRRRDERREASRELRAVREARKTPDPARAGDFLHAEQMMIASDALREAIGRARRGLDPRSPATLIWRQSTGADVFNWSGRVDEVVPEHITLGPPRDPCPMCGVRQDIGCKHRRIG